MEGSIVDTRDGRRRPFRWQPGTVVFGSGVEADLVLPDPAVAAKHGRFEVTEQGCKVVVEEGGKPVKVNGISTHESDVEVGDVVKIGPFQLSLSSTAAAAEPAAAPEPEAAAPPPPPRPAPVRRPVASRHSAAAARGSPSRTEEPELDEAHAASRFRARNAGKQADARSWLIGGAILAGVALIAVGFIAFSGNPWSQLGDDSRMAEQAAVNDAIKACDFDGALAKIRDLLAQTKDSSIQNRLIDQRDRIEKHKANFNEGKRELERIRNTVGKRQTYYIVNDDLPLYMSTYGAYAPLVKEAQELSDELHQKKVSMPAPTASEADLAPGQAAPAFEKRNEHGQGKEGAPKDAPIKDGSGKDGGH